jgi:predicted PurR-regulated permease PerM
MRTNHLNIIKLVIKFIASFAVGFTIGAVIAMVLNAIASMLSLLIGKTATVLLLWVMAFALGFFGMRAYVKRNAKTPVLRITNK